jgi:hypothetical protein
MRTRTRVAVGAATAIIVAGLGLPAAPAGADTAPIAPTPPTVSSDVLPTPQINGVVWSQVVVGNRVYVTGNFSQARPFGSAPGTNQVARGSLLAYDLTTGALITTWAPKLNGQGMALAASPDGTRIYVVGDFTTVNGITHNRIAALDATTGVPVSAFSPSLNGRARALAVIPDGTVYAGGSFSTASGVARQRIAAFAPANGAVKPFNATAEQEVIALTAPAGSGKVIVGGRFTVLSGVANYGLGAVNATTGAALPFPTNATVRDAGPNAGIWSLSNDGAQIYGTGYTFGTGGNFEGSFASNTATGALVWVNGCLGDTYAAAPAGPIVYTVGHAHNCSQIGFFPEQSPRQYQRAIALTRAPGANARKNVSGPFLGKPAPDVLHWAPTISSGTFTGQGQGAWHVTATSSYVLLAGEFPKVNGISQQGLARFAIRSLAPNHDGPQGFSTLTPKLTGAGTGKVKAIWTAEWDRDNQRLTYQLLRGASAGTAVVVSTQTVSATWWSRPSVTFTDTVPSRSTQVYRVRATDPLGNSNTSATSTIVVP